LVVLMAITPTDATGNIPDTPAGTTISIVGVCLMVTVIITALAAQWSLRRRVYPSTAPTAAAASGADPAVAAVLAARARRAEARALAAQDPVMARELHIGRPDLESSYDDGGLVDLNSAPTAVIARVCDIEPAAAQAIAEARERVGSFSNLDEVLVISEVSLGSWALLREHAILLPR
jgi:DNA uptake protein ComE-like DNA-binding protein